MIKKSIKGIVLAIVLTLGIFAGSFVGVDMASVYADTATYIHFHNSESITKSYLVNLTGLSSAASRTGTFTVNGSSLGDDGIKPVHDTEYSYTIKTWISGTKEGSFTAKVYRNVNVSVNTDAIGEARNVTYEGCYESNKAYVDQDVVLSIPVAGEGNVVTVKVNDVEVSLPAAADGVHNLTLGAASLDQNVSIRYTKDTDSFFTFAAVDGVTYKLNGEVVTSKSVSAGTPVTITAEVNNPDTHNMSSLTVGDTTIPAEKFANKVEYSFTTPAVKGEYAVSAAAFASSSTIRANIDSVDGLLDLLLNANITIKYTNTSGSEQTVAVHDLNFISLSGMSQTSFALSGITGVKDNTTVSITLAAKDGVNNDLINFEVNDIASTETGDTQTITFTADPATTYVFDYDVINTTSEISLDSATKECLKNGSLSSIVVTVDGVATTWTKDNTSTIKALKDSTVSVEYFAAEHYAVSSTTITGVIATDNTFIAPATKQNITISATTRYTSNTITIDSVSNTKTLVDAGKIEVYVNSAALTDSTVIHTATAVTISAASLTNDEIASIVVTDGTNTYNSVDGVVTFTTAENLTYTITVVTTATENYVTVVYDESVTGVTINGVEYVDSEFEVEKLTDITIAPSTLANYKVTYITVTANGEEVEVDDLTFTGFKATKYIVTIYTICTDNIINIASDTITAIRNGSITSLIVNGETISNSNKSITVAKDSVISFAVTTNDYYLVDTITLDGVTLDVDTFTTTESTTYTLAVNIYDASNSIVFDGDENLSISVNDEYHYNKNSIPMNATVTLTVTPAKGEYIVEASLTGADATIDYVSSQAVITFTAGVDTDYVLAVTSAPIFSAVENNYVINQQDINLMVNGNDYARSVVYNGIWNNVFATTTDLTVDDVTFEYLAGHANINLIIYQWNIDIYTPIDEDVLLTKMDLCEYYRKYIKEVFGIEEILGTKITAAKIAEYITDEDADATLAGLTDFGSQETETIRLVFAGNDKYNATKLTNTVGAMDLRENATLDLNERVSIAYGSYLDNSAILELLLEGRLGVVSESGVHAFDYNPTLILSSDMVGKAAGEYAEITVTMPANYHYRKATATVTIEITKADISLEMTKSVVNYQLVLDGTLNKDYVIDFNPDIVIEDNDIDHIYFTMGLDLVNGELIARLDLSNMRTAGNAIEQGIMDTLIGSALKAIDPEGNGLTLSEFVDFSSTLGSLMGNEGINSDVSSLGSVSDLLQKVDDAIDIRIMIVFDDSDITPNNHGVYFVGAVTTDANYNMAIAAGYLVITAEIVNVDFVANGEANNIRKFEYDGTRKTMTAEAYDVNNAVLAGTMTYYYLGVQTDATMYASTVAPLHAGAYTVCAVYTNGTNEILPTKVGVGLGAMLIVPSDKAEVSVANAVYTYDGKPVDYTALVTTNNTDAKLAYITAGITTDGHFSEDGFKAIEGVVNIDFPARFDALLEEYFPEEYATGVNADTLIRLLNSVKSTIAEQGYEAGFVDSIIDTLNQIPNLVTVTFSDLATVAPKKVGVYLLAAVVFDPDYMPKANMGIVVIQPTVTMSDMVWNYTDDNGIITVPAMQKMDMTATIVGEGADQEISYIFFGFNAEGKFTKLTDMSALTEGAWLQLAYVKTDISATMNFVKPIARMFVVVPQSAIVTIDDANNNHLLLRTYNGSAHTITASATTLNGTPLDNAHMVITYVGVDSLGNKYNSTVAPTNAGVYTVIATYIKQNNGATVYVGFDVAELVIALADSDEIVVTDSVVCYDEAAHNVNVELDSNYAYTYVYVTNNTLNVVLPESWDIALDDAKLNYVLDIIKEKYDINEITYNNVLPTEIGTYNIAVIAYRENYKLAYAEATLTINDHDLVAHEAQAPTCTEFGWEAYNTCANCDYTTYVQIAALGHDAVVDAAVAATCTATGLTEGSHCDRCGATLVAQETVAIIPHNTVSHEALAPTCLEAGHNAYETCVDCAYTTYEEIAALGHHAVVDAAVAATCTATGLTEGSHCDRCGAILVAQEKVAIIPHSTVNHNGMAATCTVSGYAPYVTCEHCDYTTYQVIPALGHNEVVDAAVAPTCTSNGLTAGSHCDRCDEILVAQDTINMIPHTHSDLLVITPATCTEQGLSHKICLVCHTELGNFNIPALGHATISHPSKAPTCTEGGWFAHVTCGRCDYTTYSPIAALGHSVVIDPAVAPTCVSTGLTAGSHCGTCNHIINAQQLVETTDHNYSAWIVVTPATSTNNGRYERSCNVCQHTEYQVIPAYGDKNMGNIDVTEGENGKVTIDEESVTDAIKENEETGKNEVVINASTSQDSLTNVEMNTSSLQQIVDANSSLTIKTSDIYATFDNAALDTIMSATNGETSVEFDLKKIENDQLTDAQVSALSNKNVVNIISAQIVCGDSTISNFGAGRVQVRIPFALDENKSVSDYKIIYIADDGSIEELETEYVNGEFVVELEHFSEYAVVDVSDSSVKVSPYVILAILAPFALLAIYVVFDSLRTLAIVRKGRKH